MEDPNLYLRGYPRDATGKTILTRNGEPLGSWRKDGKMLSIQTTTTGRFKSAAMSCKMTPNSVIENFADAMYQDQLNRVRDEIVKSLGIPKDLLFSKLV